MNPEESMKIAALDELSRAIDSSDEAEFDRLIAQFRLTTNDLNDYPDCSLLVQACKLESPSLGLKLLSLGHDPNKRNPGGTPPLHAACNHSEFSLVEALLKAGADPCGRNAEGWTPIYQAAFRGCSEIMNLLLDHGAEIQHALPGLNWTPLHAAIYTSKLNSAKPLIERGASMDEKDKDGLTPAGGAIALDAHDAALWLIAQGSQPNENDLNKDTLGLFKLTPSQAAARGGHCDLLMTMMSDGRIDARDDKMMQSLRDQALHGSKEEAVALIDASRAQAKMQAIIEHAAKARACLA